MKKLLAISAFILLASGCNRFGLGKSGPPAPQVTQYTGKLDKVRQIVDENGQQIAGTFTVADGQDALTMLRSFRAVDTTGATGSVTSIDAISPAAGQAWLLYINGKISTAAAGDYKVKDGDVLEWKLGAAAK